jgi:hypothetical protein
MEILQVVSTKQFDLLSNVTLRKVTCYQKAPREGLGQVLQILHSLILNKLDQLL